MSGRFDELDRDFVDPTAAFRRERDQARARLLECELLECEEALTIVEQAAIQAREEAARLREALEEITDDTMLSDPIHREYATVKRIRERARAALAQADQEVPDA